MAVKCWKKEKEEVVVEEGKEKEKEEEKKEDKKGVGRGEYKSPVAHKA